MAKRRRTNGLIITAYFLLVAATIGFAYITNSAPKEGLAKGELWHELRTGCLYLAGIAVAVWLLGFFKMKRTNRNNGGQR